MFHILMDILTATPWHILRAHTRLMLQTKSGLMSRQITIPLSITNLENKMLLQTPLVGYRSETPNKLEAY